MLGAARDHLWRIWLLQPIEVLPASPPRHAFVQDDLVHGSNDQMTMTEQFREIWNLRRTKNSYQIDPHEAVPEVSQGKGYINQEKMRL